MLLLVVVTGVLVLVLAQVPLLLVLALNGVWQHRAQTKGEITLSYFPKQSGSADQPLICPPFSPITLLALQVRTHCNVASREKRVDRAVDAM